MTSAVSRGMHSCSSPAASSGPALRQHRPGAARRCLRTGTSIMPTGAPVCARPMPEPVNDDYPFILLTGRGTSAVAHADTHRQVRRPQAVSGKSPCRDAPGRRRASRLGPIPRRHTLAPRRGGGYRRVARQRPARTAFHADALWLPNQLTGMPRTCIRSSRPTRPARFTSNRSSLCDNGTLFPTMPLSTDRAPAGRLPAGLQFEGSAAVAAGAPAAGVDSVRLQTGTAETLSKKAATAQGGQLRAAGGGHGGGVCRGPGRHGKPADYHQHLWRGDPPDNAQSLHEALMARARRRWRG